MDNSKQSKQVLLSVIGVAILVVAVVGVSFAFFNYTRTSSTTQSIQTGQISFTSSQTGNIAIANFFPTVPGGENANNSSSVTINIDGSTTYPDGIDYRVRVVDVQNYTSTTPVPIQVTVTETNALNDGSSTRTIVSAGTRISNNLDLVTGHIAAGAANAVSGILTVTASLPANVAITDTYAGSGNAATDQNGTTDAWVDGRTVMTTEQWNSLATNNLTFKIRVEAKQTGGVYMGESRS